MLKKQTKTFYNFVSKIWHFSWTYHEIKRVVATFFRSLRSYQFTPTFGPLLLQMVSCYLSVLRLRAQWIVL